MTDEFDFAFDDLLPRTWGDAFPWLSGAAGSGVPAWWHQTIADTDFDSRRSYLAQISELAMERLNQWSIGQIFPGLPPELDLSELRVPVRASNALGRNGCHVAADLIPLTLDSVMDWRQVGVGTVDAILRALADASTSMSTPTVTATTVSAHPTQLEFAGPATPGWVSALIDDLSRMATWYATVALPGQPLLGTALAPGTPEEIVKARQRLETLRASDVLSEGEVETDVATLFDDALDNLDPRAAAVLGERLFADTPATLDEIGRAHGVTRERVRQIEGKARGALLSFVSEEGPLAAVAASARDLIGTIRPLDDLLELIPALDRVVGRVGQPAWRVLDRLDDAYEISNGWCVVPTMAQATVATQTLLQERADTYGVVRLDEVNLIQSSHPDRLPQLTASWLSQCGYIIHGDFVLTRTSSVGDYAAAVLSMEGSPLSVQEIVDRFVFERTPGSTRNAMSIDDRFERVDRDRWALKEWGLEAYSGIRSVIREVVARGGGRARLEDVIEYITARYSVSGNSVIAYATSAPFMTKDGVVQLAGERTARKPPERTRRLFRRPDGWAFRVRITTDHLRGSGSVAPMAIATILELQTGQTLQLDSPLGPQSIAWTGIQPSFGTIRRFLMEKDVSADTEAFLVIHDNGTFSFEQARELVDNPLVDALSLIGAKLTFDREAARVALATAIGLPTDSPVSSIIGGYRARGDDDVAELLLSVRDYLETGHNRVERPHSAEVDEILDLL